MRWLIKSAQIVAPDTPIHGKQRDVLIENGIIASVKAKITASDTETIAMPGLHVSMGWIDSRVDFRDPGEEYKEGLLNGLDAAANGGFTGVVVMPGTQPAIDHRAQMEYLLSKGSSHVVHILPAGSISKQLQGEQLAELYDMRHAGAVCFTDDRPIERPELMRRALEYSSSFGGVIATLPYDLDLLGKGCMHEGATSTVNGLKGIPEMTETVRLMRDIEILRYTGGQLHVFMISSARAVGLIRSAKKEGLAITCGVSAQHLFFNESALSDYNTHLKVLPPLRSEADRKALIKAVNDGTIDVICSDHRPEDIEHKDREFVRASFGIGAIEQTFSAARTAGISTDTFVDRVTRGVDAVFNLPSRSFEEGQEANLTLFLPDAKYTVNPSLLMSKGVNNPYIGKTLTGRIVGVMRGNRVTRSSIQA